MSLIASDNSLAVFSVLAAVVALGCWIETRPKIGQFGVIAITFSAVVLNATGVLPRSAETYDFINAYLVPLAIPLLLFNADMRTIIAQIGPVLLAFIGAVSITVLGVFIALAVTNIHPNEQVWGGIVAAGFIGSAGNTVAVAAAMEKTADPFFGLLMGSLYVATVPFVMLMLALPGIGFLWRLFSPHKTQQSTVNGDSQSTVNKGSAHQLAAAVALSGAICWVSAELALAVGNNSIKYLAMTAISVALASLLPKLPKHVAGHQHLGQVFLYFFFVVMGVQVDFANAFERGSEIILFGVILLTSHLSLMAVFGRLFKIPGAELLMASVACILGPPAAAAVATSRQWGHLLTPGILCGVLGYVVANFIGVGIASF